MTALLISTLSARSPRLPVDLALAPVPVLNETLFPGAAFVLGAFQVPELAPETILNAQVFGEPRIEQPQGGEPVTIAAPTVTNAQSFDAASVTFVEPIQIEAVPVENAQALGDPTVTVTLRLAAPTIVNGNEFADLAVAPIDPPSETSYDNPGGMGDRTASIAVTTNLATSSGNVQNLVDGITIGGSGTGWNWSNGQTGGYIQFDFGTPQIIDELRYTQDNSATSGLWRVQGSNDGSNWEWLTPSFLLGGLDDTFITIPVPGQTTGYRYYRLQQIAGTTSGLARLHEFEFKILAGAGVAKAFHWNGPFGFGDRSAAIAVTASFTPNGGALNNSCDGDYSANSTGGWWESASAAGLTIQFDFGAAVAIWAFAMVQSTAAAHGGSYVLQGSDNGADWTTLSDPFSLGGARVTAVYTDNETAYRYYRILGSGAGSWNSGPWVQEFEFGEAA